MKRVHLKGLDLTVFADDDHIELLKAREAFVIQYCKDNNLDIDSLSMSEIIEIRKQPGWKTPRN